MTKTNDEEMEKVVTMTLSGLDESNAALEQLKNDCVSVSEQLKTDIFEGAKSISSTVESVHQFIVFEQQVIGLFGIDSATVVQGDDSLSQAESDMHDLLVDFSAKSDATDLIGVSDLFGTSMPELLARFQALLPMVKEQIEVAEVE